MDVAIIDGAVNGVARAIGWGAWFLRLLQSGQAQHYALGMALGIRQPDEGLVHHSDRGSQYASEVYRRELAARGIVCSMSERGQCWDNAPVESFFGRLKCELAPDEVFATRDQARAALFEYLEVFYNRVRRHSSLGFVSPAEFERAHSQTHR